MKKRYTGYMQRIDEYNRYGWKHSGKRQTDNLNWGKAYEDGKIHGYYYKLVDNATKEIVKTNVK